MIFCDFIIYFQKLYKCQSFNAPLLSQHQFMVNTLSHNGMELTPSSLDGSKRLDQHQLAMLTHAQTNTNKSSPVKSQSMLTPVLLSHLHNSTTGSPQNSTIPTPTSPDGPVFQEFHQLDTLTHAPTLLSLQLFSSKQLHLLLFQLSLVNKLTLTSSSETLNMVKKT